MRKKENIWIKTNKIYDKCKGCTLLSSFVMWATIFIALLFPIFGFGLAFFVMCFLCVGFKKNVLDCLDGKTVKIENVFSYYKNCIICFCIKICTLLQIFLWSLLLIIPGIITGLNLSFA